ncbi:Hypothetical predicted protein [Podarcis lilfordi]|uniref:C3H1-type domain-containing protein n=1 Tax=Podarcis lilfordi TaxID=74358 RepID=A0AA35KB87_9SAUR|nr:Hypothetical predicted protein [Podarcis lilfordi]
MSLAVAADQRECSPSHSLGAVGVGTPRAASREEKAGITEELTAESDSSQSSDDDVQELLRQNRILQRRLARAKERLDKSKSPCRRSREGRHRHRSPVSSPSDSSSSPDSHRTRRRKKRSCRLRKHGRKCRRDSSDSSDLSGTCDSSCGESEERCKGYWVTTHKAPGLPSWIWERHTRRHRRAFGAKEPCGEDGLDVKGKVRASNFKTTDQPPGIQLKKNIRNRILNGEFVDLFALLSPAYSCSSKFKPESRRKKEKAVDIDRTFDNWLAAFASYVGLVAAAYPDRAWHLANYLGIILKAKKMAGDSAALAYDELFRERTAEEPTTRWDIKDNDLWSEVVAPNFKKRAFGEKSGKPPSKVQRVAISTCWEFNGLCSRDRCRFDHACERCGGPHSRTKCFRAKPPFRSFRKTGSGSGAKDAKGDSGASTSGAQQAKAASRK